jgi:predicted RNA-binding protein with PIN domain
MGRAVNRAPSIVFIDGYNLLHKVQGLGKLLKSHSDAARRGLVDLVCGRAMKGAVTWIVFDGVGEQISAAAGYHVVYSGSRSADEWIRVRLEREIQPRQALVVTSDAEVARHAKSLGARVEDADAYLGRESSGIAQSTSAEKPGDVLSDSERRLWLKLFENR